MIIKPGSLCFDIGAHYGETLDKLTRAGAGRVICVEADHANYLELLKIIERGPEGVEGVPAYDCVPIHAAAGWSRGTLARIVHCDSQSGLSTTDPEKWLKIYGERGEVFSGESWVPTTTLDDLALVFGQPHYVKIDVEGAEKSVLMGMQKCLPQYVSFEFHREFLHETHLCCARLDSLGYGAGCWTEADVDYEQEPDIPIAEFMARFAEANPQWGNVTLSRKHA